ncbi:MAG: P-loop NTPase [Spirochaetia bacterium]|jgi:flagellar biosynthesis protein FlhG|nr:P-loop NTPase [Spirochaetia bacterium]
MKVLKRLELEVDVGILIPIASGKGGVGKTVFTANLGAVLASYGKTVILVDLDLGGANLHTCLGVRNTHPGVGSIVWKKEKRLENLVVPTDIDRLFIVPGDNLLPGTANLEFFTKKRIMKELLELNADFVLLDLGAGASYNVVDFWLMAPDGIIVTAPEIPSVLNAYSFLKTAAFRLLFRSFAKGSAERDQIVDFVVNRTEGQGDTFLAFAESMARSDEEAGGQRGVKALAELGRLRPRVVVNMGNGQDDANIAQRLREISARNLGIGMEYIAYIMRDQSVTASVSSRSPLAVIAPDASFVRGVRSAADRIIGSPVAPAPGLELDDEDLFSMIEQAFDDEGSPTL